MNENSPANFVVHVHVGGKVITVACGSGMQRVKWAAHVGVARTDDANFQGCDTLGVPTAAEKADGTPLDMTAVINDVLKSGDYIVVSTSMGAQKNIRS